MGGFKFEAMFAGVALQTWCPVIRGGSGRSWSKALSRPCFPSSVFGFTVYYSDRVVWLAMWLGGYVVG